MAEASKSLNIPQIEKLRGTTNYHTWHSIATTFLDIMGVWDVVTGKTPKPDGTDTIAEASWVRLSQHAKGFILLNIDRGLMPLISAALDAPTAGAKLEEIFDRKTPTSLHMLLKTSVTLRCSNKCKIPTHIEKYDQLWQRLLEPTAEATSQAKDANTAYKDVLEAVLLPLATSEVTKGALFLTSLPSTLDNVVDNLTTKESATYSEVYTANWICTQQNYQPITILHLQRLIIIGTIRVRGKSNRFVPTPNPKGFVDLAILLQSAVLGKWTQEGKCPQQQH